MTRCLRFAFSATVGVALGSSGLVTSAQTAEPLVRRWLIAPSGQQAEVRADSSVADLQAHFGRGNVTQARLRPTEEGAGVVGTIIYAGDAKRRLEIEWKARSFGRSPARVTVYGTASEWGVAPGITLGTSLEEIERLNGGPFTLTGFGWEYSGTVLGWNGGALTPLGKATPRAVIRLRPAPAREQEVRGDREFRSDSAPMQELNPRVYELVIDYVPYSPAELADMALQLTSGGHPVARLRARPLLIWPLAAERGR